MKKEYTGFHPKKDLKKVSKYTRAHFYGKAIICPYCFKIQVVYHFSWFAIVCKDCHFEVKKTDFYLYKD